MLIKRNLIIYLCFFLSLNIVSSQDQERIFTIGTEVANDVYIPFSGTFSPEKNVDIFVEYIEDAESSWPPTAMAAFDYAVNILSETLTSDVPINIEARYIEFGLPPFGISNVLPITFSANFASSDPLYRENTLYPAALANKLAGVDLEPNQADISIEFNSLGNWYFGTDGDLSSIEYDFITVALSEMLHGIGFLSTANVVTPPLGLPAFGTLGRTVDGECYYYPFDYFLVRFDDLVLTETPTMNDGLCSGDDEDQLLWSYESVISWGESSSNANGASMYAPSEFDPGYSLHHLNPFLYEGTANGLMIPFRNFQEAIHDPGEIGIGILQDIGWEAMLTTGIEDNLEIVGFDLDCFNSQNCPFNGFEDLYIDIQESYDIGDQVNVIWDFTDEQPYSPLNINTAEWSLELLHNQGTYIHESATGSSNPWWSFTLNELPAGFTWMRNNEGQIRGRIKLVTDDLNGYVHEANVEISINHAPTNIDVDVVTTSSSGCSEATLSFYAPGATSYEIMYQPEGLPFVFFVSVPSGQLEYTFDNLNEGTDYLFIVDAYNDYGGVDGGAVVREACDLTVTTYPNPVFSDLSVLIDQEKVIDWVKVTKQDQPAIYTEKTGTGSNFINVNVADLPPGMYTVKVYDENGDMAVRTIIIL